MKGNFYREKIMRESAAGDLTVEEAGIEENHPIEDGYHATHDQNGFNEIKTGVFTTGFRGGDSGHGGYASLTFQDLTGGADIRVVVQDKTRQDMGADFDEVGYLQITFGGDDEIRQFAASLEFAARRLREGLDQLSKKKDA